ncbi:MAG: branched-chain amino acid ABC transporter permease [Deltaproteobacteria bacterium]|nr:branched-chain amino acid ABC transporter permease [Deltaproteobacteria bacterium]
MTKFLQTLVSSLSIGSLYALIALGYTLVYGILRFINFAHSDVVTLGAWLTVTFASWLGWSTTDSPAFALIVVLMLTMGACALIGITIEAFAYRPLRRAPRLNVLITAIGVSLFLQNFGQLKAVFGPNYAASPELLRDRALFSIADVPIQFVDVIIVLLAAGLVVALELLVFRTRLGRGMRAVSFDERIASLMGVDVNRVITLTFAIGSALAGAAGLMLSNTFFVSPTDGSNYILKAYIAVTIGGWGNLYGAVCGAMIIALLEVLFPSLPVLIPALKATLPWLFTQTASSIVLYVALLAIMFFRPQGLFGEKVQKRA